MTKKIILACAGGFSTSMLMERMKEAAAKHKVDVAIDATAAGKLNTMIDSIDILLLGPQVGHLEKELKNRFEGKPVIIQTISSIDYGMMNGEKVLSDALGGFE